MSQLQARHYENAIRGAVFFAANPIDVLLPGGVGATTYTGFCLSNPNNSQRNLVLLSLSLAMTVPYGSSYQIHLAGAHSSSEVTHTTPLGIQSAVLGKFVGAGLVDSAATLPVAPTSFRVLVVEAGGVLPDAPLFQEFDGTIVLPPGGYLVVSCIQPVSPTAKGITSMAWAEVPI